MAIISIFNKLQNLIPHNISPKPASYLANDEFNYRSKEELKIWGYKDTLGISQIKYTDIMNEADNIIGTPASITNTTESKGFFSTFSSSLKTVYDFGVKSFNIIKNTSSILSSKVAETFNLVSNKVFSYLNNKAEETFNLLDQLETLSDNELVEEILNISENELDEVFEKMTYEKLAKLINNTSDEDLERIVDSHSLSGSLVQQIITLIYNKKCAKQESDEVSDSDSRFSDYEDEIEVSGNQVGFSNSDFTTKLSGNDFGFFDYESDHVVYL